MNYVNDNSESLSATAADTENHASSTKSREPIRESSGSTALSVCVVCCSSPRLPHNSVTALLKAFAPVAVCRPVILSEYAGDTSDRFEVISVRQGTKLSKLRSATSLITSDLVCICDPDFTITEEGCRTVLQRAAEALRASNEVVAFGILEGRDNGTLLSKVIAIDKWISHRILRRFLWSLGVGITLPGQFLILSPGLLRKLDSDVDSYLDDLYLGLVARKHHVRVQRLPIMVGQEDPRTSWGSLLTQRLRWMRGLVSLFAHLRTQPASVMLLVAHYAAYHGLPILIMVGIICLVTLRPVVGAGVFLSMAFVLAVMSKRSFVSAVVFLAIFPAVHLLATLLWWMPVPRSILTRR